MSAPIPPPYYILVSQATPGAHSQLAHPTVQFHYADDSPTALLPTAEHPNVIILEPHQSADSTSNTPEPAASSTSPPSGSANSAATLTPPTPSIAPPSVQCLSSSFAVTAVRVVQPPAAAVAHAMNQGQDPNIYIVDYLPVKTSSSSQEEGRLEDSMRENPSISTLMAQFHQRNALLRSVLETPTSPPALPNSESEGQ
ncbi:hypothetical protein CPB86DRAFT_776622 [Serendipita vermifera]|nr:hypothetical protein CPB86DRAFT_776622 [Serendipita vermifera]